MSPTIASQRLSRASGLEAQRKSVLDYLNGGRWNLIDAFTEVESGKRADRPELARALAACRLHRATLLIAKIDRLSRDAAFLLNLRDAGVDFVAANMPDANRMTVGIMAIIAEHERDAILGWFEQGQFHRSAAAIDVVSREVGISVAILERWRAEAQGHVSTTAAAIRPASAPAGRTDRRRGYHAGKFGG